MGSSGIRAISYSESLAHDDPPAPETRALEEMENMRAFQLKRSPGPEDDPVRVRRHAGGSGLVLVVFFTVALTDAGCYPKAGPAPEALSANSVVWASTRWPGVTASSLALGRDLFLTKCNGCHEYPDLSAIADARWPGILEGMARKAHLGAEERDAVLHYVLASRSEGR